MVLAFPIINEFTFITPSPVHIEVKSNQDNWASQNYGDLDLRLLMISQVIIPL